MSNEHRLYPVILSGGSGTRLWPLSRSAMPKQLLALDGAQTMIQNTVLRAGLPGAVPPILICNDAHRFLVAEQMQAIGVRPGAIVLEPQGRNTAPAAAVAALIAAESDPKAIVLLLPSDHVVAKEAAFRDAVAVALRAAEAGNIVTFGMAPTKPETGYGYIQRGGALPGIDGAFKVRRFVEKPDGETAARYLADGGYFWNSGMFVFRADVLLEETARHVPEVMPAVREAVAKAKRDPDFIRLDGESFARAPNISIDYGVMEHTGRAALVPCAIGWSDVGSWSSLWEIQEQDEQGNVLQGDVIAYDTRGSFVRSEKGLVALVGARDLAVVATKDAVLVADKSRAQDVKAIVDRLKESKRSEAAEHARVFRPWGNYETLEMGEGFQVKRIVVNPGGRLSLQMHHHRAEHWIVVQGTARITCNDKTFLLSENESTYIPIGATHRIENPGKVPLHIVEVQS
ncbi:MAG TPA: mannose-1-phosphate guanylyltransferase/mannose-6-phosphate isomerase, partial [Rhizomicrobium sp.]